MTPDDIRDAFRKVGVNPPGNPGHGPDRTRDRGHRHGGGGDRGREGPPPRLPDGYLKDGYFNERGHLREDLLDKVAEEVALAIGESQPTLTTHQLRRFFNDAKAIQNRLGMLQDFDAVRSDIKRLKAFARDAQGKKKIPREFLGFIEKNVDLVNDKKSFEKGFIEHFQAVVANFSYRFPKQ